MESLDLVKLLRKLWAFVANLLPAGRVHWPRRLEEKWRRCRQRPLCQRTLQRVGEWRAARALGLVVRRFYWRDHRGDRVELGSLPADVRVPLRAGLTFVALALLLILYATRFTFPAVDASSLELEVRTISAVAVYVALAGLAIGFGALLAAGARSHYAVFLLTFVFCSYGSIGLAASLPRPGMHGLLALFPPALALAQAGELLRGRPRRALPPVLLLAFVGGIVLCRMTSLARLPTAWLSACGIGFLLLCALDRCRQPESAAPPPAGCGVAVLTGGRQMTIGCEQLLLRAGNRLVALAYLSPLPTFERLQPDFARMVGSLRLRSEKGP